MTFFCAKICVFTFRSNPGTPTQPRRPDFIGVNSNSNQPGATYYDFPMQHHQGLPPASQHQQQQQQQLSQLQQQQQQQQLAMAHHNGGPRVKPITYGSPQRRFLSEGELVRQGAELSYARTNNTVDNIRELAGSPQRGVYMWKDNSPGYNGGQQPQFPGQPNLMNRMQNSNQYDYGQHVDAHHHRSNPTSPTQQQVQYVNSVGQRYGPMQNNLTASGVGVGPGGNTGMVSTYHPALRGGVPVFPPQPSPQIKRKATPTRPISFVRALEMTDSMEMTAMSGSGGQIDQQHQQQQQQQQHQQQQQQQQSNQIVRSNNVPPVSSAGPSQNVQRSTTPTPDRASVYDMNYEISV